MITKINLNNVASLKIGTGSVPKNRCNYNEKKDLVLDRHSVNTNKCSDIK